MKDRTPWLVIKSGPDVPANVMRVACLRCGDVNDTPLPVAVSDLVTIESAFRARHRNCKETPNVP